MFLGTNFMVQAQPWINEIHYDNNGGDVGEGIEIAGAAGTDLSCLSIVLYNGNTGNSYSTTALSGIIPDEGCGYGAIWFAIANMQNGGSDGLALVYINNGFACPLATTVIQFLSYEGTLTAANGPAAGQLSVDIGVAETGSTPIGQSLQLTGAGNNYAAFTWSTPSAASTGSLNTAAGQSITPCGGNSVTTGALTGAPFTADCGTGTGTNGSVAFTSTGTFNAPNIYVVQLSDATGSFASPVVIGNLASTANAGNIPFTIPSATVSGAGYLIRIVATDPAVVGSSTAPFTITQTNPCSITTGAVATTPFAVNCTTSTTAAGTVAFTSTGVFNPGNVYTVELSDETGSFIAPTVIGTLASTANAGSINITIPFTVNTGAAYVVRVISSDPAITGSTSAAFTITQMAQCLPSIPNTSGLIINEFSNGSTGAQEYYEFVVAGECGALVDIRGFILDDNNGTFSTNFPLTGSGVASGHFRFSAAAQWAAIPVGSLIVVYNACDRNPSLPADDPSDLIIVDSLYVVPHTSPLFESCGTRPAAPTDSTYAPCTYATAAACPAFSWGPLGLRNAGDAIQVRSPNGAYFHGISYGNATISGGPDNTKLFTTNGSGLVGWFTTGDFRNIAQWQSGPAPANETPGLPNDAANLLWLRAMRDTVSANCPIVVLPVELSSFSGRNTKKGNLIMWSTDSERDASHFIIERSTDAKNWENIHYENAVGNSTNTMNYSFVDDSYDRSINYYRLNQFDIDGANTLYNRYIYIDNSKLSNNNVVRIVNVLGQDISADTPGIQIHVFEDGSSKKFYK